MKYNPRIKNLKPFLNADGQLFSFNKTKTEKKYQCLHCLGQMSDTLYREISGGDICLTCSDAAYKAEQNPDCQDAAVTATLAVYMRQLSQEDFCFVVYSNSSVQFRSESSPIFYTERCFEELYPFLPSQSATDQVFQRIRDQQARDYKIYSYKMLNLVPLRETASDSLRTINAVRMFKRFVDYLNPESVYSTVRKRCIDGRWIWVRGTLNKAIPEEVLLRGFFYFLCRQHGADYRSAIQFYRRLEPLETLMKICFSKDKWYAEREKSLLYLLNNPKPKRSLSLSP